MKRNSASVRRRNRRAALNRAARNAPCGCPECQGAFIEAPPPLLVAFEGEVGIAVVPGELFSPDAPPLYTICVVDPFGSVAFADLEFVSPQISVVRGCLDRAFIPDGLAVRLGEVADLLPDDLSGSEWNDVLSFDLALALNGPVTADQRARLRGAVQMFNADAYSSAARRVM